MFHCHSSHQSDVRSILSHSESLWLSSADKKYEGFDLSTVQSAVHSTDICWTLEPWEMQMLLQLLAVFLFSRPSLWWLFHLTEGVKFWHLERKFCSLLLNFENLTVIHISDCNETKMLSTIFILHFTADIFYWLEILTYWNKREKLPK